MNFDCIRKHHLSSQGQGATEHRGYHDQNRPGVGCAYMLKSAGFAEDAKKIEPVVIGDAKMLEDGTIIINLRRTADGINVSGIIKYVPAVFQRKEQRSDNRRSTYPQARYRSCR
jgi:hypothetical protein